MTVKEFRIQYALGSLSGDDLIELVYMQYTPKAILTALSKNKNYWIRCGVACNPNTPIKVLTKLSNDKDRNVRIWVTRNPYTPIKILEKLSNDTDTYIRRCAREELDRRYT